MLITNFTLRVEQSGQITPSMHFLKNLLVTTLQIMVMNPEWDNLMELLIAMVNGLLTLIVLGLHINVLIILDTIGFMIKAFRPVTKLLLAY